MTTSKSLKVFFLLTAIILSWIIVYFILSRPIKIWKLPSISKAIAFSSDGTMLATGAGKPGRYKIGFNHYVSGVSSTVEIRRVADAKVIQILKFFNATSIAFSPDDKLIAAGHRGKKIRIWRVSDGELISTFEQSSEINFNRVSYLAFSNDNQTLLSWNQKYSSERKSIFMTLRVES